MRSLDHPVESRLGKPVALVETVRDERLHMRAHLPERLGEQAGRRDAVDIEVAEDGDLLARRDGGVHAVGDLFHAGYGKRVRPVALKRGREEEASLLDRLDAVGDHDARDKGRDAELGRELVGKMWVLRGNDPAVGGPKRCHGPHLP